MSAVTAVSQTSVQSGGPSAVQHLHLHQVRTHWATKYHENLGAHLQDALDILDSEGWEVVAAYATCAVPDIILRRRTASA